MIHITENRINLSGNAANILSAIRLDRCEESTVSCNELTASSYTPNNTANLFPLGIEINNTQGTAISCNKFDLLQTGIVFSGSCINGTQALHNEFGTAGAARMGAGLYVRNNASVDDQFSSTENYGNEWQTTANTYTVAGARHDGTPLFNEYIGKVKGAIGTKFYSPNFLFGANGNTTPTTNGTGWFSDRPTFPNVQCPTNQTNLCATNTIIANTGINTDVAVASGVELTNELAAEVHKWDVRTLYTKLKENPNLALNNVVLEQFRDSLDATFIADFYLIAKKEKEAKGENNTLLLLKQTAIALDSLQTVLRAVTDSLEKANLTAAFAAKQVEYQQYELQNSNWRDTKIQEAKHVNQTLQPTELHSINEKIVNEIYFNTIAVGVQDIDARSLSELQSIAVQCPILGGAAVYRARDLVYKYNRVIYNDHDICTTQGISFRVVKPKGEKGKVDTDLVFSIFPNPSTTFTVLKSNHTIDNDLPITISDTYGRLVSTNIFYKNTAQTVLNTETWVAGIYYCKIGSSLHKIVIVK